MYFYTLGHHALHISTCRQREGFRGQPHRVLWTRTRAGCSPLRVVLGAGAFDGLERAVGGVHVSPQVASRIKNTAAWGGKSKQVSAKLAPKSAVALTDVHLLRRAAMNKAGGRACCVPARTNTHQPRALPNSPPLNIVNRRNEWHSPLGSLGTPRQMCACVTHMLCQTATGCLPAVCAGAQVFTVSTENGRNPSTEKERARVPTFLSFLTRLSSRRSP